MATANSLFSEKPPVGLLIAQAVGITASAFLFGQNTAISVLFIPVILKAPAPLAAQQWQTLYDLGKPAGISLSLTSSAAFAYVASHYDPASLPFKLNVAAAVLLPSIMPFTLAVLLPTNNKLFEKAKSFAKTSITDKAAEVGVAREETTHALIDKWAVLNLARAGIIGVASVLGIWAAVDKRVPYSSLVKLASGANRLG